MEKSYNEAQQYLESLEALDPWLHVKEEDCFAKFWDWHSSHNNK